MEGLSKFNGFPRLQSNNHPLFLVLFRGSRYGPLDQSGGFTMAGVHIQSQYSQSPLSVASVIESHHTADSQLFPTIIGKNNFGSFTIIKHKKSFIIPVHVNSTQLVAPSVIDFL